MASWFKIKFRWLSGSVNFDILAIILAARSIRRRNSRNLDHQVLVFFLYAMKLNLKLRDPFLNLFSFFNKNLAFLACFLLCFISVLLALGSDIVNLFHKRPPFIIKRKKLI